MHLIGGLNHSYVGAQGELAGTILQSCKGGKGRVASASLEFFRTLTFFVVFSQEEPQTLLKRALPLLGVQSLTSNPGPYEAHPAGRMP